LVTFMTMEQFEAMVKTAMENRGINQRELADGIGVTPAQMSRIIKGERGRTPEVLSRISTYLGLNIETIFRAAGLLPPAKDSLSEQQRQLIHLAEQSDEQTIDLAIAMLEAALKQRQNPQLRTVNK
jgi:transcriptional regulator with XRE-family HTH domain